ncbi:protein TBATA isoform X3 [Mesocricetus auratus]|uniref:Protein TBATA isoform X3 n=1 Tax=Mesocricetus auratus TaxID=10036 RepID=A0ABM2WBT7_MESAU|nr:protein TBATA isoform X3 [Mesocricetus auratus]XP_040588382.1 protein TBATA isoform X3 [Mesocricetus auratus]
MTMEVKTQLAEHPLASPKAEPESEKKPAHFPRSLGDAGFQKGPVVPGIVDFDLIQEELKAFKPQTPSAYRFGRLSHHSFFSRHHPQPHHVTHIQDLIGKPVCMVRDEFSLAPLTKSALLSGCLMGIPTISVPVGDPQSIRNPQLSSEAWKKNLKDLASRVANFAKETEARANEAGPAAEQRSEPGKKAFLKEEPPQREQGAKYSAETGRLIPASSYALSRRSRQGQRGHPSGSDGGAQASIPQDQDLLGGLTAPGVRFSGLVGRGPRAGLTEIHLPRRAPTPDFHSYSRHLQHGLGSPQSTSRKQLDDILPLLDWRRKGEPLAEEAARSQESRLLHWMEPLTRHLAEAAHSGQQTAYSESPTSWQTSPDSWRSWVGRPLGYPQSPPKRSQHVGLDLGASLSDSTDGFSQCYPVLAPLCPAKGKRPGTGTSADSGGSAHAPASPLPPSREALESSPRASRTSSRDTAGNLQSIPEEDEDTTFIQDRQTRVHGKSPSPPRASQQGLRGENNQVKGRELRSRAQSTEISAWLKGIF